MSVWKSLVALAVGEALATANKVVTAEKIENLMMSYKD